MAVAIGVPLLVYLAQDALIFHRQPLGEGRRAQLARQADVADMWLSAADGTRVHAWHLKSGPALVLYFGGNAEEVSWMLEAARAEAPGVSWLLLDYRGYGLSEGAPSQQALVADALALYDHAANLPGVDARRIFVGGLDDDIRADRGTVARVGDSAIFEAVPDRLRIRFHDFREVRKLRL